MPHDVTSEAMAAALVEVRHDTLRIKIGSTLNNESNGHDARLVEDVAAIRSAAVVRTDPSRGRCADGFCRNGPAPAGGHTWTLTLTTDVGNVSPTSPTARIAYTVGDFDALGADGDGLENYDDAQLTFVADGAGLSGTNARVVSNTGHSASQRAHLAALNVTRPFSLAYGGGGGAHGGTAGGGFELGTDGAGARAAKAGATPHASTGGVGAVYGDALISDLLGGSGGAAGHAEPFVGATFASPRGRGGAGGGAIEIVAANDITVASLGVVAVDGGNGVPGHVSGGGGGSAGSIVLSAGGTVTLHGLLSARGGDGGHASRRRAADAAEGASPANEAWAYDEVCPSSNSNRFESLQ